MSLENPFWGAPRIHGELLKLGFELAQSTVAKYMVKRRPGSTGQTWKTFLRNHAGGIAAMDFLVVPTVGFRLLFVLVILRHQRRRLLLQTVTDHPTAEWIARQITEAFPWVEAPAYLIRDRGRSYGGAVIRRIAAMGIRDHPIAPRSPWQNGYAERLIGSIRQECLDHIVVWARHTCGASLRLMPTTTTTFAHICRWQRIHHTIARFREAAPSSARRSSAGYTITTAGHRFR